MSIYCGNCGAVHSCTVCPNCGGYIQQSDDAASVKVNPMTNPLEQIRELVNDWQKVRSFSGSDLAHSILAILDASQGYVCVPVEGTKDALLDALNRIAMAVPETDGSGNFIIDHHSMDGEYIGTEQIDPMGVVQWMAEIAQNALIAASKETNRE